jgi:hypothetical protein
MSKMVDFLFSIKYINLSIYHPGLFQPKLTPLGYCSSPIFSRPQVVHPNIFSSSEPHRVSLSS